MRFIADGPDIPDDLLWAQDEGRVVFFCGAGVSRARADLPDFKRLTTDVLDGLGTKHDSPARRLYEVGQSVEDQHKLSGVVTSDRVFGLLEREFTRTQIEAAVAEALSSGREVDLSAHRTLLKLSTLQTGQIRIVTTNFDRLFEEAGEKLITSTRSNLPHIAFNEADWGIVHLHGVVDEDYRGATQDGFVLSSASFGDAYLAAGWAREFVKNVLDRHVAVFVGYSADDPPIRYLLEGLRQSDTSQGRAYAFQDASNPKAIAEWDEKGVDPILYDTHNGCGHRTLWDSLEIWAKRSANPSNWRSKTLKSAARGPRNLTPAERGAVAHIVRSTAGAKAFAQFSPPLPSEWLCVFDPVIRYGEPAPEDGSYDKSRNIDPFDLYKLDSDHLPRKEEQGGMRVGRIPPETWDAFAPTPKDLRSISHDNVAHLRGYYADEVPRLPPRIDYLADWIGRVAYEPACAWWAGQQANIYRRVMDGVDFSLFRKQEQGTSEAVLDAWRAIKEFHSLKSDKDKAYALTLHTGNTGWYESLAREYADIFSPCLKLTNYRRRPVPPKLSKKLKTSDLVQAEVDYSEGIHQVAVPDAYLPTLLPKLKSSLEFAWDLESRRSPWVDICSIEPDEPGEDEGDSSFHRSYKLSGHVILFTDLFKRLADISPAQALALLKSWPAEGRMWERMRVWAFGNLNIAPADEFADVLLALSRDTFWPFKGERDLLLGLSRRWDEISTEKRKKIEKRIRAGHARSRRGKRDDQKAYVAHSVLRRLIWLNSQGCSFTFDLDKELERLRKDAPDWNDAYARSAASAHDGGGGMVRVDTDFDMLSGVESADIIPTLLQMNRRPVGKLVEYQPFSGLSAAAPKRALDALRARLALGHFEEEFWDKFLRVENRKGDTTAFRKEIIAALCKLTTEQFSNLSHSASFWLESAAPSLLNEAPESYQKLWALFVETLKQSNTAGQSALVDTERKRDWVTAAINSAPGRLAEMLVSVVGDNEFEKAEGLPASWKQSAEQLLALPQDTRAFCICVFCLRIRWFNYVDPSWTQNNLLSVLQNDYDDRRDVEAFWAGVFSSGSIPQIPLYTALRPHLEAVVRNQEDDENRNSEFLAVFFLSGWKTTIEEKRVVSNEELRSLIIEGSDRFQSNILWKIDRFSRKQEEWSEDLVEFLRKVWPKQKSLRTSKMSARLVELALAQKDKFPEIAEIVATLVTKVGDDRLFIPELRKSDETIAGQHPTAMLTLLYAVLPDDKSRWPYGAEAALSVLAEAEPSLRSDSRFIELNQRS